MKLFTTVYADGYFKSFISLNEFTSICHTPLANVFLSHTESSVTKTGMNAISSHANYMDFL